MNGARLGGRGGRPKLEALEARLLLDGLAGQGDLIVQSATAPASADPGVEIALLWTVRNQGTGDTEAAYFNDAVYLSRDAVLDLPQGEEETGDYNLLQTDGSPLAAGESYTTETNVWLPWEGHSGINYLLFVTDGNDEESESDETNNVLAMPIEISPRDVDVTITAASAPATLTLSEPFTLSWTVARQGEASTQEYWADWAVLSTDTVMEESDVELAWLGGEWGLPSGGSYTRDEEVSLPGGLPTGPAYILIMTDVDYRVPELDEGNNLYTIPVTVAVPDVDLQVTDATAPASAELGTGVSVSWTVLNAGTEDALGDWYDSVYVSADAQLDAGDEERGSYSQDGRSPLAAGASYTQNATVYPTAGGPRGSVYLLFVTDRSSYVPNAQGETDETNNVLVVPITLTPPAVDLRIDSANVPAELVPGQRLSVSWTGRNYGTVATTRTYWHDGVYLSQDDQWDTGDEYLCSTARNGAVAVGGTYSLSYSSLYLPQDLSPGPWYVLFVADYGNSQAELDEDNNVLAQPVTLIEPDVDLVVTSATVPPLGVIGKTLTLSWTVANQGSTVTNVSYWPDMVYLSQDEVYDASDVKIGTMGRYDPVQAGGSYTPTANYMLIPAATAPGEWYLLFQADGYSIQAETDEDNNFLAVPIALVLGDLSFAAASAPAEAELGGQIAVSYTISCSAAGASANWWDKVYLSTDATLEDTDTELYSEHVVGSVGEEYSRNLNLTIPATLGASGTYYLLIKTDWWNHFVEQDETNNLAVLPIEIGVADLVVTAGSVTPDSTALGEPVHVSYTVRNDGTAPARGTDWGEGAGWYDAVYLSADDQLDDTWTDPRLDEQWRSGVAPLAAGADYTVEWDVTLANSVPAGARYLIVYTNSWATQQTELSEANNTLAIPIALDGPDLAMTNATGPSSAVPGASYDLSWTVTNQGAVTAYGDWADYGWLSTDDTYSEDDRYLWGINVGDRTPLAAGGNYLIERSVVFPQVEPGSYYMLFLADSYDKQGETDETNNAAALPVTVSAPDLVVTEASTPPEAVVHQLINVSWTVANQGGAPAPADWYDGVFLSRNMLLDGGDARLTYVDQDDRSPLLSGASYVTNASVRIPPIGTGAFYLLFVADRASYSSGSRQGESDETNNILAVPITIDAPDLQVTAASAPTQALTNSSVPISFTVTNAGSAAALSVWYDSVYLSSDPALGSDTRLVDLVRPKVLAATESYDRSWSVNLPNVGTGQKYLLIATDSHYNGTTQGETDETNNLFVIPIEIIAPDVVVSDASVALSPAVAGQEVDVSWTVLNQGTTAAQADWQDAVYLSQDEVWQSTDRPLHTEDVWSQTPLAAGADYTIDRTVTLSAAAQPGDYFLLFRADRNNAQGETDETNNVRAVPIQLTAPDLVVTGGTAPTTGVLNGTVDVSWTVLNQGTVTAYGDWFDSVQLSTDAVLDGSDEYLESVDVSAYSPLPAGQSYTASATVDVPSVDPGDYYLLFVVDGGNDQGETDETNTAWAVPITLGAPNLAVTSATAPDSAILSDTIEVSWTVTNQGTTLAPADWYDRVYLSSNVLLDGGDRRALEVSAADRSPLGPGQSTTFTETLQVPVIGTGSFYLLFVTDAYDDQAESSESDNLLSRAITLAAPDLVVTDASAPAAAVYSQEVQLAWTVTNQGSVEAPATWYDSVYLSRDTVPDSGDLILETVDQAGVSPLAAGGGYHTARTLTLPSVGTGQFYWLFVTDRYGFGPQAGDKNDLQGETSEINNVRVVPVLIDGPDLEVNSAAAPAQGIAGQIIQVSYSVLNAGGVMAPADWSDAVYLSADEALDATDLLLGTQPAGAKTPLAAGASYSFDLSVTVPNVAPGPRYLLFVADDGSDQGELNEANNLRAEPIEIFAPDLTMTAASAAVASASLGAAVSVSWTVLNQGVVAAPADWSDAVYLSDKPVWDGTGMLLGTEGAAAHSPLAAGASYTATRDVILPDFPLGAAWLFFQADRGNKQGETDETNNVRAVPIQLVAADLVVEDIAVAPAALLSGRNVTVQWRDANTGSGATPGTFYDRLVVRNTTTGQVLLNTLVKYDAGADGHIPTGESRLRQHTFRLPDGPPGAGELLIELTADGRATAGPVGDVPEYNASGTAEANNTASVTVTSALAPYPDLVVSDIVAPPEAVSGTWVPISWTVTNIGDADAVGPFLDMVCLSEDAAAGGDREFAALTFTGTIPPGGSATQTAVIELQLDYWGDRYVVVDTNANRMFYEHSSQNNVVVDDAAIHIRQAPMPNLQVASVTPPTAPFSGQQTLVEWTVTNAGTGSTGGAQWTDAVWLSRDGTLDGGDVRLGGAANVSYLDAGQSYAASLTVTLPASAEGSYYFLVKADADGTVYECQWEGDNVRAAGPVEVQPGPTADLRVTSVQAPAAAFSGQATTVSWRVANEGAAATAATTLRDDVYLSADTVLDGGDIWLGRTYHHGALGPGASYEESRSVTPPDGLSGTFYFLVMTDLTNQVFERAGEANNVTVADPPTPVYLVAPDLEIVSVDAPTAALAGATVAISYRIANNGTATTPHSWEDGIYLSQDDQWDGGDVRLLPYGGSERLLGPGQEAAQTASLTLPDDVAGIYYIVVRCDTRDGVFELDETNNVALAPQPITIASAPADLAVTSFTAPAQAEAGKAIVVEWTVANEGTGPTRASTWTDALYLSIDTVLSQDDVLVADWARRASLAAGASYSQSKVVTIPWTVGGNCYFLLRTDERGAVYEAGSEDNNISPAAPVLIEQRLADLAVTEITADATAIAGGSLSVSWKVANNGLGRGNTSSWVDAVGISSSPTGEWTTWLGQVARSGWLNSGSVYSVSVEFPIPEDTAGTFYVTVAAGTWGNLLDADPQNNERTSTVATVIALPPVPDLSVSQVDAPVQAVAGQPFDLSWTVRNEGAARAPGQWYDAVYLSRDLLLDTWVDTYVGYVAHATPLAAGSHVDLTETFTVPSGLTGLWYAFVVTDSGNRVHERDTEGNNVSHDPYAMLIEPAPPADLVAGTITIPANATPGWDVSVTYTVENQGTHPALGSWYDSLYLSLDDIWDVGDAFLGRVLHRGDVEPDNSYAETFTGRLPGVLPGDYHVILRTDIRNHVRESNEQNNVAASLERASVDAEALVLDVAAVGGLASGQSAYYRVDVPAGETLELVFDSENDYASNELYVRHGAMPTRGVFDYAHPVPFRGDQRVVVPVTQGGTYYILAHTAYASAYSSYSLTARLLQFAVDSASPSAVGNAGPVTLELTGSKLTPETAFELVDPSGQALGATAVYFVDATRAYATFGLAGAAVGAYDVRVRREDGAMAELPDAVQVAPGTGPKLQATLVVPQAVRPGRFTIAVEYANVGDGDLYAPVLHVSGPADLAFGLSFGAQDAVGDIRVLGYSPTGPAGVLRPGQRESLTLYCSPLLSGNYAFHLSTLSVDPSQPTPQMTDWDSFGQASAPPFADPQEWAALWKVLSAESGASWQEVLINLARRLTEQPTLNGRPNILVGDVFTDLLSDAAGQGGGLLDVEHPWILTHSPVAASGGGVEAVEIVFSEGLDPASFTPAVVSLTDAGGNPIGPVTLTQVIDRLWRVTFPVLSAPGEYGLRIAPTVTDTVGQALDQDRDGRGGETVQDAYDASFRVGPDGTPAGQLYVVSLSPSGQHDQREGVDHLLVRLSRPIFVQTFTAADVTVAGPAGPVQVLSVEPISSTTYRVALLRQDALGGYTVEVGPDITALDGHDMDQDADGTPGEAVADRFTGSFVVADIHGPQVVAHSPNDWMPEPVDAIDVTFNEPVDAASFTPAKVALTGPEGAVAILDVQPVAGTGGLTFRLTVPSQTAAGQYTLTIGPDVRDVHGNAMDQDADDVNGTPTDAYAGTFGLLYGVSVAYGPGPTTEQVPLDPDPADYQANVAVKGRVVYSGLLADYFPSGAHVTVQLWEQDGNRDNWVGQPLPGDPADDLVATTNLYTGQGWTNTSGHFLFEKDTQGYSILNVDLDEIDDSDPANPKPKPAEYYVIVFARNEHAHVVQEGTVTTTDPNVQAKPWFTPMHPSWADTSMEDPPVGAAKEWGELFHAPITTSPTVVPKLATKPNQFQYYTMADVVISDVEFEPAEWIRYGANWISYYAGQPPRRPIAVRYPSVGADDCFFQTPTDYIFVGSTQVAFPVAVLHEYGHSLHFAACGYQKFPTATGGYGIVYESPHQITAYQEAWPSFVAAGTTANWKVVTSGFLAPGEIAGDAIDRNRSAEFLETNNFWMGWDGYGLTSNAAAGDSRVDAEDLAIFDFPEDGINDNANTGDWVMGAIESIFWDLADSYGDDQVSDLAGMWQTFVATAAIGEPWAFYNAYVAARPGDKRFIDAVFIDNGMPVADDDFANKDEKHDFGKLKKAESLDGLILAYKDAGKGDEFKFTLPEIDAKGKDRTYELKVTLEATDRGVYKYGDLDLRVHSPDYDSSKPTDWWDTATGKSESVLTIPNLHTSRSYTFTVIVYGHGAVLEDWSTHGGDYHPSYKISITPSIELKEKEDDADDEEVNVVAPIDPNDIVGPAGSGPARWIPADEPIGYMIRFENSSEAQAPARQVTVTQTLDADLDWRTFRVGDFGWGDVYVDVPDNRAFYTTRLDLRGTIGLYVDVAAGLDIATGTAFWTLTAIDPATGETPTGALAGFLPPNDADHAGEGFVTYTARPKADSLTGTVIDAVARIVFDTEPPLDTPPIFNTLDASAPTSTVQTLAVAPDETQLLLDWAGDDDPDGSGLESFTVFVSVDGGPFAPWLTDTTLTAAPYLVGSGRTYAFYSTARDNAGNVEPTPAAAQAQVALNTLPLVDAGADAAVEEGSAFARSGSFADPDAGDSWTATVDYGDGSGEQTLALDGMSFALSHVYADEGTYDVLITVTDSQGVEGIDTVTVLVSNADPTVDLILVEDGMEGQTLSFSATASDVGVEDVLTYTWDFDDGTAAETGADVSHVYADDGEYTVTLTVTDGDGGMATGTRTVHVSNADPTVDSMLVEDGMEGETLSFSATASDVSVEDALTYTWDFDDGTPAQTGANVSHVYADNGEYTVTLTVTDGDGGMATGTRVVHVSNADPTIESLDGDLSGNEGDTFTYSASAIDVGLNDVLTYEWDFGDGSDPVSGVDLTDVNHAYGRFGEYTVTLTVTDGDGGQDQTTWPITVNQVAPPVVSGVAIDDGSGQRSMVRDLTVVFDQAVTLDDDAIAVVNESGDLVEVGVTNPSGDEATYVVSFAGAGLIGSSLADGHYRLAVSAEKVRSLGGLALAEDHIADFHRLFGDVDGDRDVDRGDYIQIRMTYGLSEGQAGFRSEFDHDGSGVVDGADAAEVQSHLNTWLDEPSFALQYAVDVMIDDGGSQRSMVRIVTVAFEHTVMLDEGAVSIMDESGTLPGISVANPNDDGATYVVSFTDASLVGGSLADGHYRLHISADKVHGPGGLILAEDHITDFHRLFGDVNGDRDVDRSDYIQIRTTYGRSEGHTSFRSEFDYDGSGVVDALDAVEVRRRLGTWLDAPAFPEPTNGESQPAGVAAAAEPQVESIVVNDGAAQRSMVTSLTVTFDQPVFVDGAAFVLVRNGYGPVNVKVSNPLGDKRTFRLTFHGPGITGGSLADGDYTLTIRRALVRDLSGRVLTDGDHKYRFHRFYGDWDGDRDVDFTDMMGMMRSYGSRMGLRRYDRAFDYDGDGDVDIFDVFPAIHRYRKALQ